MRMRARRREEGIRISRCPAPGMAAWVFCNLHPYLHAPEGDVRVAEGGADDLDADLVRPRRRHLHLLHLQRLPRRLAHRRCATITGRCSYIHTTTRKEAGGETEARAGRKMHCTHHTYLCI